MLGENKQAKYYMEILVKTREGGWGGVQGFQGEGFEGGQVR